MRYHLSLLRQRLVSPCLVAAALSVAALGAVAWPVQVAQAAAVDLSIQASSIHFSEDTLIAGHEVRIYAAIKNSGDTDATAQVYFYQGSTLIGASQWVSVLANGGKDDIFVDFTVPSGSFNIRATIQGATPADTNPNNNEAITPLYKSLIDTDNDNVTDEKDNCRERSNPDQADLNKDGEGDACDTDIDGDGVLNAADDYPTDKTRSKTEVIVQPAAPVAPVPTPVPAPTPPAPRVDPAADDDPVVAQGSLVAEPAVELL